MKTIISIIAILLAVFGYTTYTNSNVATFGDGISITSNFTVPTTSSSTVVSTSTLIVATSTARNYLSISNDSNNVIYLSIGGVARVGKGIRLATGTTYEMKTGQNIFTAAIYGVATASSNVSYIESTKE